MSFEHNPADEDRESYDNGLMVEEIKSLQATIAAQAAAIACAEGIHQQMTAELAALRSQLDEQRKRLDMARKFVFHTSQGAIVVEPLCSGWRCYRDTMDWTAWENLIDPESNSMKFASLDKLFTQLDAANWLTPHAEQPNH